MNKSKNNRQVNKPLPLKQRTSSVDGRRDYTHQTWWSVLGLLKLREFFVTVDHFSIWRRHLAWSMEDGRSLRDYMTQRYASSMVFMSLLLSTELNILFHSVNEKMRSCLHDEQYWNIEFWIGIVIIISTVLTLLGLISTFTAWSMVSCVDPNNAHCILRSSIGQYVAELPGRLIVGSIYSFLLWVMMFFFVLMPVGYWSIALAVMSLSLFAHTICCLSAFGRIIMHSGAMGHQRVFEQSYEKNLVPHSLHAHLLARARDNLSNNTSILRQYRSHSRPIDGTSFYGNGVGGSDEDLPKQQDGDSNCYHGDFDSDSYRNLDSYAESTPEPRRRADSIVRFADEVATSSTLEHPTPLSYEPRMAVPEGGTPISHLSTASSSWGDSAKASPAEEELSKSEHQQQPQKDTGGIETKPPRPVLVGRNRSNTTATDNEFDALPRQANSGKSPRTPLLPPSPSPRRSPPPPSPPPPEKPQPNVPARAGSEGTLNVRNGGGSRAPIVDNTRSYSNPDNNRTGTGSIPPPGLSVLENAAKLQLQYRNSYKKELSRCEQRIGFPPPSPTLPANGYTRPPVESDASLQKLWVTSGPSNPSTEPPGQRMASITPAPNIGTNQPARRLSSVPPPAPSSMPHLLSADALYSGGSGTNSGAMSLSEEDEAFRTDYDSNGEEDWGPPATEAVSLLGHDHAAQSFMSVADTAHTTQRPNTGNQQDIP